jgi:hypothetical protein
MWSGFDDSRDFVRKRRDKAKAKKQASVRPAASAESQAGEAATIAWTVAVTMTLACDLTAAGAHFFVDGSEWSRVVALFRDLLLFGGAVIGALTLLLIPVVYRLRRVPPPNGFTAFAVCVAVAPIVALIARAVR